MVNMEMEMFRLKAEKELLQLKLELSQKEGLRLKGRLTSRGIFEYTMTLIQPMLVTTTGKTISNKVSDIACEVDRLLKEDPSNLPSSKLKDILIALRKCKFTDDDEMGPLQSLYSKLSNPIHGSPWSGESILIRQAELPFLKEEDRCDR